jgi:uncharacterized membrane protein
VGIGAATAVGLTALGKGETLAARSIGRALPDAVPTPVASAAGHAVCLGALGVGIWQGVEHLYRNIEKAGSAIESLHATAPDNPHVSGGPASGVAWESMSREGRRFAALPQAAAEIADVMGSVADEPVRVFVPLSAADSPEERARIALDEMDALGAFDRSIIVLCSPTGTGYINYVMAEAVEYLTRGDCAIVTTQYSLRPSFLSLDRVDVGRHNARALFTAVHERVAAMPAERRPRLVQFGESLGAEVALDVAEKGTENFKRLGLSAGLYLGTPFRTALWQEWRSAPDAIDPSGLLGMVSRASEIPALPRSVTHVQVIHDDDPINKFSFEAIVRPPWWMGEPTTRPPGVPRETVFRPVVTFVISLIDLKNGMNSKPGEFVRVGHDYRIELREAIQRTFGLSATPQQEEMIEQALRSREREWATRRMVARGFAKARNAVLANVKKWGVDPQSLGLDQGTAADLARGRVSGLNQ